MIFSGIEQVITERLFSGSVVLQSHMEEQMISIEAYGWLEHFLEAASKHLSPSVYDEFASQLD